MRKLVVVDRWTVAVASSPWTLQNLLFGTFFYAFKSNTACRRSFPPPPPPPSMSWILLRQKPALALERNKFGVRDNYCSACKEPPRHREWFFNESKRSVLIYLLTAYCLLTQCESFWPNMKGLRLHSKTTGYSHNYSQCTNKSSDTFDLSRKTLNCSCLFECHLS